MRFIPRTARSLLTLLLFAAGCTAQSVIASNSPHTGVRLLVDVQAAVPGASFTAGILMTMDEGWHTYWMNPGEAGLATRVRWELPAGFTAGALEWPAPQKYLETGDVLTYGYAGETMLLTRINVPSTARPGGRVMLSAHVEWLECERICVPGEAEAYVRLPVTTSPAGPANAALFDKYRALVPRPFTPEDNVSYEPSFGKSVVELRLSGVDGTIAETEKAADFYPEPLDDVLIGRTERVAAENGVTLKIPITASKAVTVPLTLQGLLLYTPAGKTSRVTHISIPLSRDFTSSISTSTSIPPSILDQEFDTIHTGGGDQSFALYFLFALIGGLLLNIMPCVLPVIALKIFGLLKLAGDKPARVARAGWAFSGGILASFLALALVVILLKLAGQQVGWGFQFQEPLFVIGMAAVVFAFGLNLFGVFEINLPGAALNSVNAMVARGEAQGKGYSASFGEGVFATILATPCTAPFLGSALGFAFAQPWWVILIMFSGVALGMALPYLILTSRPAWLKYLPKPGAWMETAKQFMGFLMMATLLWLLYVLGKQLGMEAVIWTGAFLLAVGIACWLVGMFATLSAPRGRARLTWAVALVVVGLGYYVFLESALNVRSLIAGVPDPVGGSMATGEIQWKPFTLAGLEQDLKGDKTIFLDFTADWCLTCKVNERSVLSDERVVKTFADLNVVAIRADWTNRNPDITRLLAKFGRSGVPLYVIFSPGKPSSPVVLPEVITSAMVIEALEKSSGGGASAAGR
ncbi:MAG: thioredoxin family protein [Bacteroidota bacterium]